MSSNGIDTHVPSTTGTGGQRRFAWLLSSVALRLLFAFIISWLIILAFFVSGVVSH